MQAVDEGDKNTRWILKIPTITALDHEEALEAFRLDTQNILQKHGSAKSRVYKLPHQEYSLPSEMINKGFIYFFYSHNGNGNGVTKRRMEVIISALNNACEVFPITPFHINNHTSVLLTQYHGNRMEIIEGQEDHPESETAPTLDQDLTFSDYSEKYHKKEEENKTLQENNNLLAVENNSLRKEVSTLKDELEVVNRKILKMEANFESEKNSWKKEFDKMHEEYNKVIEKLQETLCAEPNKKQSNEGLRELNLSNVPEDEHKNLHLRKSDQENLKPSRMEIEENLPSQNAHSTLESLDKAETSFGKQTAEKQWFGDESKTEEIDNTKKNCEKRLPKAEQFYYSAISGKPLIEYATKKGLDLFCATLRQEEDINGRWSPLLEKNLIIWRGARVYQLTPKLLADLCFSFEVEIEDLHKLLCYLLVQSENSQALPIYKKVIEQLQAEDIRNEIRKLLKEKKDEFQE